MCDKIEKARIIFDLASSLKCLAVRPEGQSPNIKNKFDEISKHILAKIDKLLEEV
jgi:hypothetical protein